MATVDVAPAMVAAPVDDTMEITPVVTTTAAAAARAVDIVPVAAAPAVDTAPAVDAAPAVEDGGSSTDSSIGEPPVDEALAPAAPAVFTPPPPRASAVTASRRRSGSLPFLRRSSAAAAEESAARAAARAAEERFVVGAPDRLAAYVTPPTDLNRLREPMLAMAPYGASPATRPRDVFVLLGNGGRSLLRDLHTIMGSLQSNRYVLAAHHLAVLHERWVLAARFLRLYGLVAERVWGGWVAAADAAAAAAAAAPAAPPVRAALDRTAAAVDAATATWARFASTAAPEALLPTLWADVHAASAAAAAAFRRVEGALPAQLRDARRRGAKRRADADALALARRVFGADDALVVVAHWVTAAPWVDRLARRHLRGGAPARAAFDANRAAWRARTAEVVGFFAATSGPPVALPRRVCPTADPARMMFDVQRVPIGV